MTYDVIVLFSLVWRREGIGRQGRAVGQGLIDVSEFSCEGWGLKGKES